MADNIAGFFAPWALYVALLTARERDDEKRCAAKYGALWQEYVRRVPRRIVPGVY
jgi:delta14-sterol reductase